MIPPNLKISDQRVNSAIDKMFLKNKPQNYKIQNKFKSLLKWKEKRQESWFKSYNKKKK